MSGIDLEGMDFVIGTRSFRIPFDTPMVSYHEARERIVQMDKQATSGLGRSDITVKDYLPPTGLYALTFAITTFTSVAYSQRWWFERGRVVEGVFGASFAKLSYNIQPYVITVIVVFHAAEMLYFIRYKLVKHSVNPRAATFWMWAVSVFIEGVFAIERFDTCVQQERDKKAKQKH